jgi:hypothetical protein
MGEQDVVLNMGLSEEERRDLERMIGEFRQARPYAEPDMASIQKQIDAINQRMAYLTNMFLIIDRRMKPLYEIMRLTFEKSEILNERINTILEALRNGEPL